LRSPVESQEYLFPVCALSARALSSLRLAAGRRLFRLHWWRQLRQAEHYRRSGFARKVDRLQQLSRTTILELLRRFVAAGAKMVERIADLPVHAIDLKDPRAANAALVGSKAANLHEASLIDGIEIPDGGFSVTTDAYSDYLAVHGVDELIRRLERLSDQWIQADVDSGERERLEGEIEPLSDQIQRRILEGELSPELAESIDRFYAQLSRDGRDALVAVRSSATSEDMPNASFAGQYKSLLNQQGKENVVRAVKEVWASTYNFNAILYRNKLGVSHRRNKMGVLILAMVNPESSGTAFTVDPETGQPMYGINNTYGLGEAEVSGVVTSDSWIIDPQAGEILKRRLGAKKIRIVYDREQNKNLILENSAEDQERFAMQPETALRLAQQMEKIHRHFTTKNPDILYVDMEYVITEDQRIIFTQVRPETVWSVGGFKIVAIDPRLFPSPDDYPVLFHGAITGSVGVATGILRIVDTWKMPKHM